MKALSLTNVKVFADKETDRRTSQKLCAPNLLMQGHKKSENNTFWP